MNCVNYESSSVSTSKEEERRTRNDSLKKWTLRAAVCTIGVAAIYCTAQLIRNPRMIGEFCVVNFSPSPMYKMHIAACLIERIIEKVQTTVFHVSDRAFCASLRFTAKVVNFVKNGAVTNQDSASNTVSLSPMELKDLIVSGIERVQASIPNCVQTMTHHCHSISSWGSRVWETARIYIDSRIQTEFK